MPGAFDSRDCAFPNCPREADAGSAHCPAHRDHDLGSSPSRDLVPLAAGSSDYLQRIDLAKRALAAAQTLADVKEIRDQATLAEVYARAQQSREAYLFAAEVRLWAERHAGEVRRTLPKHYGVTPRFDRDEARRLRESGLTQGQVGAHFGVDGSAIGHAERNNWEGGRPGVLRSDFDAQFQVHSANAKLWERLAELPEERFVELLAQAKERDTDLTARGLLRHAGDVYETRVEPEIYRLKDGRLSIRHAGVMEIVGHVPLETARARLSEMRGGKARQVRKAVTVGDVESLLERAADAIAKLQQTELDPGGLASAAESVEKAREEIASIAAGFRRSFVRAVA